jgi:hypothetical protein
MSLFFEMIIKRQADSTDVASVNFYLTVGKLKVTYLCVAGGKPVFLSSRGADPFASWRTERLR